MNTKLISSLFAIAALNSVSSVQAFNSGDIINFKPGESFCLFGGTYPVCQHGVTSVTGSYFAMDISGDGVISPDERIAALPGTDGGIVIGALQLATGSHSSCPNGSEISPVDSPWCFGGNTGMHQVTGIPVTDNGDGTLDFTGWGVTWNGISNIPMGAVVSNAVLSCSSTPCTVNDIYEINFTSSVPINDPSGFGGLGYQLHLESNGPATPPISITVVIEGGTTQECSSEGGSNLQMNATTVVPEDDSVASIDWIVDGVTVASGADISAFIALGVHNLTASLTTVNGFTGIQDVAVTIRDTTSPVVTAAFLDKETGSVITEAVNSEKVILQAEASDICDPAPVVTAQIGAPVVNGQKIKVDQEDGKVKLHTSNLTLSVTAVDASGRTAIKDESLIITQ